MVHELQLSNNSIKQVKKKERRTALTSWRYIDR